MKKNILYVDHAYHKVTHSTDFFVDILEEHFNVTKHYVEPGRPLPFSKELVKDFSAVIILQMDHLALLFLALGVPTIVIPMYDGSGGLPELHWKLLRGAHFINFSYTLHTISESYECKSLLLKYFIEPKKVERKFDSFKCFFWQRRPDHHLHWQLLNHVIGSSLESLHIHDAPDIPGMTHSMPAKGELAYDVTVSKWFEKKRDMQEVLNKANIYFAPRLTEGIGMGFLEAMASGMVVVAPNMPTYNEYIAHGVNGYLYNPNAPLNIELRPKEVEKVSARALESMRVGYDAWKSSAINIVEWVEKAIATPVGAYEGNITPRFYAKYFAAYNAGLHVYNDFLQDNSLIIDGLISVGGKASGDAKKTAEKGSPIVNNVEKNSLITFGKEGDASRFLYSGWNSSAAGYCSLHNRAGSLMFNLADQFTDKGIAINISARGLDHATQGRVGLDVSVNGRALSVFHVGSELESLSIEVPAEFVEPDMPLFVKLSPRSISHVPDGTPSMVSVFVHSIMLTDVLASL